MWVYDPQTLAFLAVNDAAVHLYGYSRSEFLAMTIKDIRPPEDVPKLLAILPGVRGQISAGVWRHRLKGGAVVDVEVASNAIVFQGQAARLVLASDVSEKKRLEADLLQAQKMDAVGRLAGGVAHDFNNLLGVISGYSQLLGKDLGPEHRGLKRVEEIQKAAERAAGLTRQLLAFSRKQMLEMKVLDLNAIVSDIGTMLHRLIGEDIQLVTKVAADLGSVRADRGQIDQVILNLVVNARDAMPHGGQLQIETANVALDEGYARAHSDVRAGRYVQLAVSDSGEGMTAETQSHIFEPFFTTKEAGKGTGLGLATVFGIVKQSGGHVAVYSEVGQGSTFRVYLPRVDEEAARIIPVAGRGAAVGGNETILLVEDADALRAMIREILESAGYAVLECSNAEEAASRMTAARADLLLTDVIMPRLSGPDLARELRAARPGLKVLFMSGYTDEAIARRGVLETGARFMEKPFTTEVLLQNVRVTLDA
jgi:two-component system, cell cycle sensor histidine kinase and response regulator CckA